MFLDVSFREGTRHVVAVFIVGSFAGESTRKRAFTFFAARYLSRGGWKHFSSSINYKFIIRLPPLNVDAGFE